MLSQQLRQQRLRTWRSMLLSRSSIITTPAIRGSFFAPCQQRLQQQQQYFLHTSPIRPAAELSNSFSTSSSTSLRRLGSTLGTTVAASAAPWAHFLTLKRAADKAAHDPVVQLRYYKELNKYAPEHLVVRYESGHYASDENVTKEYLKALAKINRLDRISLAQLEVAVGKRNSNITPQTTEAPRASLVNDNIGTSADPLHLTVVEKSGLSTSLINALLSILGFAVLCSIVVSFLRSFSKGASPLGQNVYTPVENIRIRFSDIKGVDEAKNELQSIVEFLKNPSKFNRLGGSLPKGVLIVGPPGTGKTLLAKAVAGEARVPFFAVSGSEFEEVYVGKGAQRVRDLFAAAKKASPCVVFIDELDAIGSSRMTKETSAMRMTLNQLLTELDGFLPSTQVVVIGATNFPEVLDHALVRPGRFDKKVVVSLPDLNGRKEILDLYLQKLKLASNVDSRVIARGTPGCSGADLYNIVNTAAVYASRVGKLKVTPEDLEYAIDKVLMGSERKSQVMTYDQRKLTAYHEGGHAIVALNTKGSHPIHKATILPRGEALGMVLQLPENDVVSITKQELEAKLDVSMAGRIAEEIIFGPDHVTTGAYSDFQQATKLARKIVLEWGFSEKLGPVSYQNPDKLSSGTRKLIDDEVKSILDASYERAKSVLKAREKELHFLAEALIKYETLTLDEIQHVVKGQKLNRVL